jgi:hypothetical protein
MTLSELIRYVRAEYPTEDLRRAFLSGYIRGRLQIDVEDGRGYLNWPHIEEAGRVAGASADSPDWRKAATLWFLRLQRRFPGAGPRELGGFILDELRREGFTHCTAEGKESPQWRTVTNHLYEVARRKPIDR